MDALHALAVLAVLEIQSSHVRAHQKPDAVVLQPFRYGEDNRVVLVIWRASDARERVNAREFLDEPDQITLQLDRAVPRLKGECGASHVPEVRLEERCFEDVLDPLCAESLLGRGHDRDEIEPILVFQP